MTESEVSALFEIELAERMPFAPTLRGLCGVLAD